MLLLSLLGTFALYWSFNQYIFAKVSTKLWRGLLSFVDLILLILIWKLLEALLLEYAYHNAAALAFALSAAFALLMGYFYKYERK